jgi:hypothetical protein
VQRDDVSDAERRQTDRLKVLDKLIAKIEFVGRVFRSEDGDIAEIYLFQSVVIVIITQCEQTLEKSANIRLLP